MKGGNTSTFTLSADVGTERRSVLVPVPHLPQPQDSCFGIGLTRLFLSLCMPSRFPVCRKAPDRG